MTSTALQTPLSSPSAPASPPLVKRPPLLPDNAFRSPQSQKRTAETSFPSRDVPHGRDDTHHPSTLPSATTGLGLQFCGWFPEGHERLQAAFDLKLVSRCDFHETWPNDWPRCDHGVAKPHGSGRTLNLGLRSWPFRRKPAPGARKERSGEFNETKPTGYRSLFLLDSLKPWRR